MEFSHQKNFIVLVALPIFFTVVFGFLLVNAYVIRNVSTKDYVYDVNSGIAAVKPDPPKKLEHPPAVLKTVYVTGWSAGSKKYLDYLFGLFTTTQINSVVIDVKDYSGVVSYATGAPLAKKYGAWWAKIPDIDALVNSLHAQNIYVIGRVTVFEDPELAKNRPDLAVQDKSKTTDAAHPVIWKNKDGLAWMDPASPEVADYDIEIAKDALTHGFDEINFDYVRFPTDGNAGTMGFPVWDGTTTKNVVIKSFFKKLRGSFPHDKISADIFGQVTSNTDDMGIGQILEDTLPYFDYVCPMVYPSHYIDGFLGYANPAEHPYQVVKYATDSAVAREKVLAAIAPQTPLAKIRPWLQDFNLGATYGADMVSQEIKAVEGAMGADYSGYLLWSASNKYGNI